MRGSRAIFLPYSATKQPYSIIYAKETVMGTTENQNLNRWILAIMAIDIQLELTTYPLIIRICWQICNYYQKLARILKIIIRLRSQVVTSNEYMHPKCRFWTEHFIQNEHLKGYFTRCFLIHSICLRLVSVVVQCSLIGVSRLSFSHFRVFHTA